MALVEQLRLGAGSKLAFIDMSGACTLPAGRKGPGGELKMAGKGPLEAMRKVGYRIAIVKPLPRTSRG